MLIAGGDRLPVDTTIRLGSTAVTPGHGEGVAQEHSFLASTNTAVLPPAIGVRIISVCDVGDPVCDYDPDSGKVTDAAIAIYTAYATTFAGPRA